jgi:hypothetical protein
MDYRCKHIETLIGLLDRDTSELLHWIQQIPYYEKLLSVNNGNPECCKAISHLWERALGSWKSKAGTLRCTMRLVVAYPSGGAGENDLCLYNSTNLLLRPLCFPNKSGLVNYPHSSRLRRSQEVFLCWFCRRSLQNQHKNTENGLRSRPECREKG